MKKYHFGIFRISTENEGEFPLIFTYLTKKENLGVYYKWNLEWLLHSSIYKYFSSEMKWKARIKTIHMNVSYLWIFYEKNVLECSTYSFISKTRFSCVYQTNNSGSKIYFFKTFQMHPHLLYTRPHREVKEHKTPHISDAWMENNAKQHSHSQFFFSVSLIYGGKKNCICEYF